MRNEEKAIFKLTNNQNKTGETLRITKENFQKEEFLHELFLAIRQKSKIRNAFAQNSSTIERDSVKLFNQVDFWVIYRQTWWSHDERCSSFRQKCFYTISSMGSASGTLVLLEGICMEVWMISNYHLLIERVTRTVNNGTKNKKVDFL